MSFDENIINKDYIFHGSHEPDLEILKPLSVLHGEENKKVLYLTDNIPYAIVYIWSSEKTGYGKWVTSWLKDGVTYYEEQFPDQLKAFYEGVSGYLYCVNSSDSILTMPNREGLFYSTKSIAVEKTLYIEDVYNELIKYEKQGKFKLYRFSEASKEKQEELTDRIASVIIKDGLLDAAEDKNGFFKKYFSKAWEKAQNSINI